MRRIIVLLVVLTATIFLSCQNNYDLKMTVTGNSGSSTDTESVSSLLPAVSEQVLTGVFSTGSTDEMQSYVRFSRGGLYWNGNAFSIEENQYDFRTRSGKESVIGGSYSLTGTPVNHNGLFYWATDKNGLVATAYNGNGIAESDVFALDGSGLNGTWDILSGDEWNYLLTGRENASSKYGLATITSDLLSEIKGLVLLPDNWVCPVGCSFVPGNGPYSTNEYSKAEWQSMESAGAVFLPSAGNYSGNAVNNAGVNGYWWSCTPKNSGVASYLYFGSDGVRVDDIQGGCGIAARPVVRVSHEHTFSTLWSTDSTFHWHAATCGHNAVADKAEHSFGEWTETTPATCTVNGEKQRSCAVCGRIETESIPASHSFSTEWAFNATHHWHAATCEHTEQVSDKALHTFEDGICSVCGYESVKPLSGVFSVSSSKQVKFSKGALYWDGRLFKVEKNQYDFRTWEGYTSVIGGEQTTEIPTGETGLFFWSGKIEDTYSGLYNDTEGTVSDTFPLANGGAIEGWDVLSSGEWDYLLSEREDASSKHGHATITTEHEAAVHGLVLLPDSWTLPDDCSWTAGGDENYWNTNKYSSTQWASMEQAGAVFLPAAGNRWFDAYDVKNIGKWGEWWSSTPNETSESDAYSMSFYNNGNISNKKSHYRNYGLGVRLVMPVND